jgi:hypothetical protein
MYIGCSINFLSRIGMHASGRNAKKFDSYRVIRVPDGVDMFDLEFRYIVKFRPPLNSFPPKRGTEGNPVSTRKTKTERICEMKLLSARHHKAFSEILGTEPLE